MSRKYSTVEACKVIQASSLQLGRKHNLLWSEVFGESQGADAISLFYFQCEPGQTPYLGFGDSEVVLYLLDGQGKVIISANHFSATRGCGLHVRRGEDFCLATDKGGTSTWLAAVCPQLSQPEFSDRPRGEFDRAHPDRVVDGEGSALHSTADRYYKLLVGPAIGSESVTQFIGRIPRSKAPEHYHLYEEVLCILSGHGRMWAGDQSAEVGPGSLIFLPREQRHSLECLDRNGMELVGMFYPAGSPAINYS